MKVQELMTPSPMTCRPADSLHEAASRIWNEDCGSLPVVDGRNRLVGMITDRDIAMAGYLRNRRLAEMQVADTMSHTITTCSSDNDVETALERMQSTRVRRLPVCDDEGTLLGILAVGDIVRAAKTSKSAKLATAVLGALDAISTPRRSEPQAILTPHNKTTTKTASKRKSTAPKVLQKATSKAPQTVTPKSAGKAKKSKAKKRR